MDEGGLLGELGLWALRGATVPDLLDFAVGQVANQLSVDYVGVLEATDGGASLLLRSGIGWPDGLVGSFKYGLAETHPEGVLRVREPVVFEDFRTEGLWQHLPLVNELGLVRALVVPILGKEAPFG